MKTAREDEQADDGNVIDDETDDVICIDYILFQWYCFSFPR